MFRRGRAERGRFLASSELAEPVAELVGSEAARRSAALAEPVLADERIRLVDIGVPERPRHALLSAPRPQVQLAVVEAGAVDRMAAPRAALGGAGERAGHDVPCEPRAGLLLGRLGKPYAGPDAAEQHAGRLDLLAI